MDYEGTTAHNTSRNMEEKQQPKYCTHTQTKKEKSTVEQSYLQFRNYKINIL